jgi:serine/threonine protein kinase
MSVAPASASEHELRFQQVAAEYLEALEAGRPEDLSALLARHPDLADEIAAFVAEQDEMARLAAPLREAVAPAGAVLPLAPPGEHGRLGDFRIVREVGRGGMGVVYEAEQLSLGRRVALKVLPFAATMDPRHLQRFHNEARAAASLQHPHIVPVFAVGQERGVHYYAMQFIDGHTLAALIARQRRPALAPADTPTVDDRVGAPSADTAPVAAQTTGEPGRGAAEYRRAAELIAQAAEALEYAHALGVVHRDVKPANLMLDAQGRLWVTDFGLARLGADAGLTQTGDLLGTLRYMSPEQALAKHGLIDHRTDVYALGATLYELLAQRPAVDGKDREEVLRRITFEEPRPPRQVDHAIPADLETITLKAMAKEPGERYATAQELADDLRRWLEDRPIQARRPTLTQRVAKWGKRHLAAVVTAAVVSLLAALGLAVSTALVWRAKEEQGAARASAQANYEQAEQQRLRAEEAVGRETAQRQRADGNFRQAVEEITALLERANDPRVPRDQLAGVQGERGMKFLQTLLAENRTDPEGRLLTGLAYLGLGEAYQARLEAQAGNAYADGLAVLQQLAADFPDNADYRKRLAREQKATESRFNAALGQGIEFEKAGQLAEAARAYGTASAIAERCAAHLDPGLVGAKSLSSALSRARLLWVLGQLPEAEEAGTIALTTAARLAATHPQNVWVPMCVAWQADACTLRGLCRAEAGQLDQAEADFRQALALVGQLAPPDKAALLEERAVPHFALGRLLWATGQQEEARREFDRAEQGWRGRPSSVPRDTGLAWLLTTCPDSKRRKPAEAVKLAKQATEKPSRIGVRSWQVLGVAHYRDGDWGAAITALEKSRQLKEGDESINLFFLAMAHARKGEKEKGRQYFAQAARWMDKNRPLDEELRRFRAEAAELLGASAPPAPAKEGAAPGQ